MPVITATLLMAAKVGTDIARGVRADRERARIQSQLNELNRQALPEYGVTDPIRGLYGQAMTEAMNPQGFSGAETARFQQNLGQGFNTQMMNAGNRSGGQMSRFIATGLGGNMTNAMNQFAAQDQSIARGNRLAALNRAGGFANTMQRVDNMNTQFAMQRRMMLEQALGRGLAMQKQNIDSAIKGVGDTAGMAGGYAMMGAMGVPPTTQQRIGNTGGANDNFIYGQNRQEPSLNYNRPNLDFNRINFDF